MHGYRWDTTLNSGSMAAAPTLIMVPGFLCDESVWEAQQAVLERRGVTVVVPEHGLLDSLGAMAETILARAAPRFAIAGHSMGGRVALEVYRRAPQRGSHLALLDTGCLPLPAGPAGERGRQGPMAFLGPARRPSHGAKGGRVVAKEVHP